MDILLLFIICALALVITYKESGWASVSFLISSHLFLGLAVRSAYLKADSNVENKILAPWILSPDQLPIWESILFMTVFILTYTTLFQGTKQVKIKPAPIKENTSVRKSYRVLASSALTWLFGSIYLFVFSREFGGLVGFLETTAARTSEGVAGLAYMSILADIAVVSSFITFCSLVNEDKATLIVKSIAWITIMFGVLLLISSGGRGNLLQYVLALIIYSQTIKNKSKLNIKIVLMLPITLIVAAVGLAARAWAQGKGEFVDMLQAVSDDVLNTLMAPFALIDHYSLSIVYFTRYGPDYGYQYLSNISKPIPRSMWESKPQTLGIVMREEFWGDTLGGIPPGYIGEAHLAFGIFGILMMGALLAVACKYIYKISIANLGPTPMKPLLCLIIPIIAFNMIRVGIDIAFTRVAIYIAAFFAVSTILKIRFSINR